MTPPHLVPDEGDVAWLDFSPHAGHEQGGRRPAVVLSPAYYNGKTGLMLCCPMTKHVKGYPYEVLVSRKPPSAILADHVKAVDWRARRMARKGRVPKAVLDEVRAKLRTLIGI